MKREYMKPTMEVVELQHQHQLLAGSITDVQTTDLGDGDGYYRRHPCRRRLLGPLSTKRFREEAAAWRRPQRHLHAAIPPHAAQAGRGATPPPATTKKI